MKMTLSMLALNEYDNTVWNGFAVPEGVKRLGVINYILAETMELPLIYPDLDLMRTLITNWADVRAESWLRIWQALTAIYNPIENYDRYETGAEHTNGNGNSKSKGLNKVNAFNDGLQDSNSSESESEGTSASNSNHDNHIHGNIGVTTNQQMIQQEIELRKQADFYRIVCEEFKNQFCIRVW